MAHLTAPELGAAVEVMSAHYGLERLRDKLGSLGAFSSRKGLTSSAALADRLYRLSGGLRLQVVATYAFSSMWSQMLADKLGEDGEKELETLADGVNACLTPNETIEPGKEVDLDRALAAYRDALGGAVGAEAARLDMLLKAVPSVAERLRSGVPLESAAAAVPAEPDTEET
jgi:hypothetical protein